LLSSILVLFGSLALVFIAALLLVNALEWLGHRLHLGSSFVGAILSPLFTSLPELIVILVALFSHGGKAGEQIGIGTIFGEPFMTSSLSYGLVAVAVLVGYFLKQRAGSKLTVDKTLSIPYLFITILFPFTLVPGFLHVIWVRYLFGIIFLGFFIFYMYLMYKRRMAELIEETDELTFAKLVPKESGYQNVALAVQFIVAIALLYFGAQYLVSSVELIANEIYVSPLALAMLVIPAATAIPETVNAIIWGYRGKDTLSLGSLVGEKILYATFYPALGMFLTSWELDNHAIFSVIVTTAVSLLLFVYIRRQQLPWYGLFFGIIFFIAYGLLTLLFKF
jgi:cation:H+ antiporter